MTLSGAAQWCGSVIIENQACQTSLVSDEMPKQVPRAGAKIMGNTAKKISESEDAATMTVVKNEPVTVEARVVDPEPELTLEQKIRKVEDLNLLIDKWQKLRESERSLQTFKLAGDGYSNQLVFRDMTSGQEFKTYNAMVIGRAIGVIRDALAEKIAEIESQIRF